MFTGNEGTFITLSEGAQMTKAYRDNFLNSNRVRKAVFFGKSKLMDLLNQSECVGARCYFAAKQNQYGVYELDLVIVGATSDEKDIIGTGAKILDDGSPCPTQCDSTSPLFDNNSASPTTTV